MSELLLNLLNRETSDQSTIVFSEISVTGWKYKLLTSTWYFNQIVWYCSEVYTSIEDQNLGFGGSLYFRPVPVILKYKTFDWLEVYTSNQSWILNVWTSQKDYTSNQYCIISINFQTGQGYLRLIMTFAGQQISHIYFICYHAQINLLNHDQNALK